MPHFEEMPTLLSDDTGPMLSPNRTPFDLPSHVRHSREKINGNGRTSSHASIKGGLVESSDIYTDGEAGEKAHINGEMPQGTSLGSMPNGRSSPSSWDHRSSRNGSIRSTNGGINGTAEIGRKSPAQRNVASRLSNGDRSSVASTNGIENTPVERAPLDTAATIKNESTSTSNDLEAEKTVSIPAPVSINPHSTGPLTYTTSLLPATPQMTESPIATTPISSPHRFSSPPAYPPPLNPSPSSQSLAHPGPAALQHRHTLQVPKLGPARNSRDGDDAAYSSGRFSPTALAAGVRRGSLNLNRRHTQSVHSNMPHEEIPVDEDALRWAEAVRQKRASKRKKKDEEDDDRVVVGTKVDQNHVNWVTAYNMLTGIRFTVSRTNAKLDRPLTDADFDARHKFSFDM
jgi:1-phosphatidylinositol-4-phosphate 5-kinase